jgi:hypothetical protein
LEATIEIVPSRSAPVVLSEALTPERILIFFGPESFLEITELLSRTFEDMDWLHVLNAVRVQPSNLICPTVQVLHGRVPGLHETKAALAVSRLGTHGLTDSQTRINTILMLLSPLGDRFSERAYLRKTFRLFSVNQGLDIRLSKLLSTESVMDAIREAEFVHKSHVAMNPLGFRR